MLPTALLSTNNNINTFSNGSKRAGGPHHQLIIAVLMTAIFHLTAADVVEFKNHAATKAFLTFLDSRGGAATKMSSSSDSEESHLVVNESRLPSHLMKKNHAPSANSSPRSARKRPERRIDPAQFANFMD